MGKIKAIRSEADYNAALARIEVLMDAEPNTPEGDELDVLTDLVEHYEEKHVPMGFPSPVAAIEFRLEQAGLAPRDLIPFIGSRAKVSEVLSGKRPLTMPMARALHEHLGIPAAVLLQQPGADFDTEIETLEWDRFPIKHVAIPDRLRPPYAHLLERLHEPGQLPILFLYQQLLSITDDQQIALCGHPLRETSEAIQERVPILSKTFKELQGGPSLVHQCLLGPHFSATESANEQLNAFRLVYMAGQPFLLLCAHYLQMDEWRNDAT